MGQHKLLLIVITVLIQLSSCSQFSKIGSSSDGDLSDVSLNIKIKKFTLDNGLVLIVHENKKLPIFSYYTFFNVGGRHEGPGTTGATHFLEHMMFKGAKKYGPGKFDTIIEGQGGSTNAYTNFDSTVYYESLPSPTLEKIVDLEADRMENLLLEPNSFEKERKVILSERKMRYENSPRGQIYLKMMQAVFKNTPYGGSVIGENKDLNSLTRDQVMDFFKKFYKPDNAVIVIAGDVDASEVYGLVKEKFGKLKPSSDEIKKFIEEKDLPKHYSHKGKYNQWIKLHGESPVPIFMMAYKGDPIGTRKSYVMDILSSVLGDGSSSYFTQKYVRSRSQKLSGISASNYTLMKNGVFYISGTLNASTNLKKFRRTLIKDTKNLCEKAINERSVQKTKNMYMVDYYVGFQTNSGIAQGLGLREAFFKDPDYYKKELEIYSSIDAAEVKSVCHEVFDKGEQIFLSVWSKHKK